MCVYILCFSLWSLNVLIKDVKIYFFYFSLMVCWSVEAPHWPPQVTLTFTMSPGKQSWICRSFLLALSNIHHHFLVILRFIGTFLSEVWFLKKSLPPLMVYRGEWFSERSCSQPVLNQKSRLDGSTSMLTAAAIRHCSSLVCIVGKVRPSLKIHFHIKQGCLLTTS